MEALLAADASLFLTINGLEWGAFGVALFQTVTLVGNLPGVVILLLVIFGLYGRGRPRMAAALFLTVALSAGVNGALKSTFMRPRPLIHFSIAEPFEPPPEPGWGRELKRGEVRLRTRPLTARSFPSGHAQHAFAWMIFMALLAPRGAVVFVTLALLVALSRVVLGVHFPLDVVVGGALGAALGAGGFVLGRRWERGSAPVEEEHEDDQRHGGERDGDGE
ncbi:MAG: hypothetical protein CMH57_06060 [Myxococcales bacterium]|nr:hypothetical protein [Myxococcales bacterium]